MPPLGKHSCTAAGMTSLRHFRASVLAMSRVCTLVPSRPLFMIGMTPLCHYRAGPPLMPCSRRPCSIKGPGSMCYHGVGFIGLRSCTNLAQPWGRFLHAVAGSVFLHHYLFNVIVVALDWRPQPPLMTSTIAKEGTGHSWVYYLEPLKQNGKSKTGERHRNVMPRRLSLRAGAVESARGKGVKESAPRASDLVCQKLGGGTEWQRQSCGGEAVELRRHKCRATEP